MELELISQSDLPEYVGVSADKIEMLLEGHVFPPPIKVSKNGRAHWLKSEVQGWQQRRTYEGWVFVIEVCEEVEVKVFKGSKAQAEARRHINARTA